MNSIQKGYLTKVMATLTMASTVLGLAGFYAIAPATALAATPADYGLVEGWTISSDGQATGDPNFDPDIYIINDWGYKRLFLNPIIFSFYGHLGGFAAVHHVSPTVRDAFPTSGLFRNCETNDPKVYGVEVTGEDTGTLHWVNTTGVQAVLDDPNFFKKVFCINNNEFNWYPQGYAYTSVNQVPNYSRTPGATPTPAPSGQISASLSSDNPSSGTIIAGQAAADLAHFTFSGTGSVTSVTLKRIGVSADTTLSNVYLYNGNTRLTDAATVSTGKITFNDAAGLFSVNGSVNISVKADIATGTSGQTVGVQLTSYTGNGSTTSTSLSGNTFTIATTPSDYATVAVGTSTPSATTTLDPQLDYAMWTNPVSVGNHDVWMKSLQLRVIGSVLAGDLVNFRLQVDGVQVGSAVGQVNAQGYVVFDLSANPFLLKTGTRTLKLLGDVIGGSNRNFTISLRQKPDLNVVDSQYGQGVLATGTFPASSGEQDINQGTLSITKTSDSPSGDIIKDTAGATFARYKFTAYGEKMKVENLRVALHASSDNIETLRNGAIFVDGAQVGSTATIWEDSITSTSNSTAYTEFAFGSSFIVEPGHPRIMEIHGDVYDSNGVNDMASGVTLRTDIIAGSSNVQRLTSLNYISCMNGTGCSATSAGQGNTLTVKTGSFTANKYTGYANQSVVSPKTQFKIGHYTLTAASSEDINVNTVTVDVTTTGDFSTTRPTDMFLKVWNDAGSLVYTSAPKSTVGYNGSASNSYTTNFTIPKTKTWQVEVYASIPSGVTTGTVITNLDAAGLSTTSNTTATATQATGQTITAASGTLTLANGASPASRLIDGGKTSTVYVFTLQPQYDDFTLDEVGFNLSSSVASATGAVAMVNLKDSMGNLLGSGPMGSGASVSLISTNYAMSQTGGTKTFIAEVQFSNVGVGANDTGGDVKLRLSHLKYHDSNGNVTTSVVDPTTYTGNDFYDVRAYPSFANVSLPSTVLAPGEQTLFKSNVTANGNSLAWRKVVFNLAVTAHPTITTFKLFENGVDITSLASATFSQSAAGHNYATKSRDFNVASTAGSGQVLFMFNTDRLIAANTSSTLELKGTVGGANVAGDSISTSIANTNGSTFVASDDVVALGGSAASGWRTDIDPTFLWSDLSAPTHASTTDDWMGDALITGIAAAQSLYQ